jgi:hypothetical protein
VPENLTTQVLDPDPSDAAVVGTVLGARGDIQFDEDGSVSTIADGQTEIDVSFLYEKVSDDYRFIENYIESPVADLKDVRCVVRKEDRKTTGFKVQLSSEHVPAGSIYRWHIKVRDALQVTQPPESQPRYVLYGGGGAGPFQPLNTQLTMFSTLPVTDFGLGALNIANGGAFRTYIGAAALTDLSGYVPTSRTITEGAGLAGNTYNLTVNRTLAMGTPSTLAVASTNSVSGTTHSHAITSSSNPGAAASILATDSSGFLTIPRLTVTGYLFVNNATANLYLKDTSTGWQSASTTVLTPLPNNSLRSTSFTSGLVGWNISAVGDVEVNNLRSRGEILASVFKVSELSATAGTFGVFFSAANLSADFTTPTVLGFAFTFHAKNSDAGGMMFGVGDILRFKSFTGSGVADAWATVASRTNNGTSTTYSATLEYGSTNVTFNAGTAVVDYGPSGTGFITLSTDGTVGSSPNLTMATHAGTPWSGFTTLMRSGNLNGSYGYASNVYGVGIGQYGTSDSWLTFDTTNGIRIGNNTSTLAQWDTSGNILVGKTGAGQGNVYITSGAIQLRTNTTVNINLASTGDVTLGNVATDQANAFWNNTNKRFQFRGSTSGTVVQSYIDTDGSFVAGGGAVKLNANGLRLDTEPAYAVYTPTHSVGWYSGSDLVGFISNSYAGASGNLTAIGATLPSGGSALESAVLLEAMNDSAQAIAFLVSIHGSTAGGGNAGKGYAVVGGGINGSVFMGLTVGDLVAPSHMLEVAGTGKFSGLVSVAGATPASAGATGEAGTVTWDASYVYVCTATNTWKRSAIATW